MPGLGDYRIPGHTVTAVAYHVPSASEPGLIHTVTLDRLGYHCTCKAQEYPKARGRCWHVKSVIAGMYMGEPEVKTERAQPLATIAIDRELGMATFACPPRPHHTSMDPHDLWDDA